ncbi:MAG: hypothetical protein ACM3ML_36920 [Micromonosporaceae bacterium]
MSSAALARGLGALVAVASYLINALAQVTSTLKPVRPLSPFYLLLGNEPLQHDHRAGGALSVLAAAVDPKHPVAARPRTERP